MNNIFSAGSLEHIRLCFPPAENLFQKKLTFMKQIIKNTTTLVLAVMLAAGLYAQSWTLASPDGNQKLTVGVANSRLYYSLTYKGSSIISRSYLSLSLDDGEVWGRSPEITGSKTREINETYDTPVWIRSHALNHCNELTLTMSRGYSVLFRAYDDGVAYRFESAKSGSYNILDEEMTVNFSAAPSSYISYDDGSGFERVYSNTPLANWSTTTLVTSPAILTLPKAKVCLMESDLKDYPALFFTKGSAARSVEARFRAYPKSVQWNPSNTGKQMVKEKETHIAECKGARDFPWRVFLVSDDEGTFLSTDMAYVLSEAPADQDWSWVKPGQAVWDWWSPGLDGVDFTVGMNTQTWLYRIDFAAKHNIPYVLVDAGWANMDLTTVTSAMDLQKIIDYGKERNVGVILWGFGFRFAVNAESLARKYSQMGVKGFKLDFWERADQAAINTIENVAKIAAKYKLIIDYHGCWPVAGFSRTYPNVVDFEGVHGGETNKWLNISAGQVEYDVTFPFARGVVAPVDYTQGAMRNGTKSTFVVSYNNPMSPGTRCRQMAMYVIFYSPLTMWSDRVTNYEKEPECTDFIAKIPTVYDETRPLKNSISHYISLARKKGDEWFVGAMTDWVGRTLSLDLSFLGKGDWAAEVFADADDAGTNAEHFTHTVIDIPASRKVDAKLAPGGGYVMRIKKK